MMNPRNFHAISTLNMGEELMQYCVQYDLNKEYRKQNLQDWILKSKSKPSKGHCQCQQIQCQTGRQPHKTANNQCPKDLPLKNNSKG